MDVVEVRLEKSGRVMIPKAVRRKLGLKEGESTLLLKFDETPVSVSTPEQALARFQGILAQYGPPGEIWSEALSEERRHEAEQENRE